MDSRMCVKKSTINYNDRNMFFDKVIEPFIRPFYDITDYIIAKFIVLVGLFSFEVSLGLFETPQRYWETLAYLVILDLIAKNVYIIVTPESSFKIELFLKKTIYKSSAYIIACTSFTLMSNQWELGSNYLQFFGYLGLCVMEFFSIMKHLKLTAFFISLYEQIKEGKINIEDLKKSTDKYSKQHDHDLNDKEQKNRSHHD